LTRILIESALIYIVSLGGDDPARVLFSAITLGGTTLTKYLKVLLDFESKERRNTSLKLSELLQHWSGFDYSYAMWLSENLHRLNE